MIAGIGCDLTDLRRWRQEECRSRLIRRFFCPEEQAYVLSRGRAAAESAGGIFAAKEAFVKALGTGFSGISPLEVCIVHTDGGAPAYRLYGKAADAVQKRHICACHLSITHDCGIAMAFCILESEAEADR